MRTFLTVLVGGFGGILGIFFLRIGGFASSLDQLVRQGLGSNDFSLVVSSDGSLLVGVILAFALAWVAVDVPRSSQRWLLGILTMALLGTSALVLSLYDVMFSPVSPILGAFCGLAVTSGLTLIGPGAFRRRVDEVFGASLSRRSLRSLYDGSASNLRGIQQARVSVLSVEMINHRQLMEVMTPEDFSAMSCAYMTLASDYLAEVGGFVEFCSGQRLSVVFGAPIVQEFPAPVAGRAALELAHRLERLNLVADSKWPHMMAFQLGLATGTVVCGVFGASRGLSYAVAGPPVELSVRLSGACQEYGCQILICMETQREVAEVMEVRPIDLVHEAGGEDLEIYELLCPHGALSPERKRSRDHYWTGITHIRSGRYDEALAEFTLARIQGIPDRPLDYYLRKIERQRKGESKVFSSLNSLKG